MVGLRDRSLITGREGGYRVVGLRGRSLITGSRRATKREGVACQMCAPPPNKRQGGGAQPVLR